MVFTEAFNYVVFDNPVSKTILKPILNSAVTHAPPEIKVVTERIPLWELAAEHAPIIRFVGLSGALAVGLGAYGSHKSYPKDKESELKSIYETGNRFHFLHTLALLATPMCRRPLLSSSLFAVGTTLFSGPCYYHAFTGENRFGRLAPIGGSILILAWLSLIF
ncbi:hypothetical protein PPYR_04451 [Photinus pyralis]|uniref:Transmembrane protein 256 homolog n=1 Tax=Photinus pyralis TaxID=7054 RepID=A0A5N4AY22_PHOPY|nr:transmembrane protein 256 homolog [Photinus pyralis]KAB0802265.1 hypothetical protein PPYR_04451 [Photinus pyralis]